MIVLRENNPHRLDGKKYSNFGNSPINYKTKMMQNNGFAMPSSHLPFFEGRQGCWRFSRDSAGFGRVGCVARDYCPFAMVAGIERFDATGGASSLPYEKRTG